MQRILLPVAAALALAAGCYTQGDVGVGYSVGYAAPAPDLVYVSPGVSVVAYADYPIFYSDNYYWRYDDGIWYRSSYYNGGWVVWHDVPYRVRSIDRPYRYTRYAPAYQGGVRDHRVYGSYGDRPAATAPAVRDHRAPVYEAPRPAPVQAPAARDHRPPTYAPAPRPTYRAPAPAGGATRDHRR
jgi:hypothetical protein